MLVLSRKENESVVLTLPNGEEILLTVVAIDHGKVRIGFKAPRDVKIFRTELLDRAQAEKQEV
jgi:carbon storage regulator